MKSDNTANLHNKWSHRWLSQKAEAHESAIHGLGVFATESIATGEVVGVLGGVIVPTSEIQEYWGIMGHVGIQIDDGFFIVPTSREELKAKGVFNHSCEPNIGFKTSLSLCAIRDITAEEELVFDYAFCESVMESFVCQCGAQHCRKEIHPTDWQKPDMQQKYGHYYSPYLRNK